VTPSVLELGTRERGERLSRLEHARVERAAQKTRSSA